MRRLTMFGLVLATAASIAACSNSGSGLTGKTWQLTAITELVPAFQGVVPAADQANYTIEFKTDGYVQRQGRLQHDLGRVHDDLVGRPDDRCPARRRSLRAPKGRCLRNTSRPSATPRATSSPAAS